MERDSEEPDDELGETQRDSELNEFRHRQVDPKLEEKINAMITPPQSSSSFVTNSGFNILDGSWNFLGGKSKWRSMSQGDDSVFEKSIKSTESRRAKSISPHVRRRLSCLDEQFRRQHSSASIGPATMSGQCKF